MVDSTATRVVIRFAGDSGDGMQLTGNQFTAEAARLGNDVSTLPNFPAEIRAPQGTLHGVSSFQVQFASVDVQTPGDAPDVLVAMNPAALRANLPELVRGGTIIVDTSAFTPKNLAKVGWTSNPLEDDSLAGYHVHALDLQGMAAGAVAEFGLTRKDAGRAKNMFALGLLTWMYDRPTEHTKSFIATQFAKKPTIRDANLAAFDAGYHFGETTEDFAVQVHIEKADMASGLYRQISGNRATAYGLMVGAQKAGLNLFLGSYPITPASDILHELSKHKDLGVISFQAEDEIAAVGAALGASFAGALGVTTTSGPGLALKSETIGLAVMTELPLIVVDVQRAGPSTGLPTKTEQSDLLQAMYGRNGESHVVVLAPRSPSDCFDIAVEATRIAVTYRVPVIILSDGYLANGAEPWPVPDLASIPAIDADIATTHNAVDHEGNPVYQPYRRDEETLARPWAIPGTPGLEHRLGGLEKAHGTGAISYDPANHEQMVRLRAQKVAGIASTIPLVEVDDPSGGASTLVIGWGSTYGPCAEAVKLVRERGYEIAHAHLRHLKPFPDNLGEVLARYDRIIVPEMNMGMLAMMLRGRYRAPAEAYARVRGLPISSGELALDLCAMLDEPKEADGE